MTFTLRRARLGALLVALLLISIAIAAPSFADSHASLSAVVTRSTFFEPDAHLAHNVPDLRLTVGDGEVDCNFLTHYESTGGDIRWGFATSEVIEEDGGSLTQYYQRGVVDCHERDGMWRLERRLVWDYLGGGEGDAPDLGVEPDLLSQRPGRPSGPWGHRVSNFAIDGTPTGFLDFYYELGGMQAFGLPKSDARLDDTPGAMLAIEGADPGVIRQYFQAAVFESWPDSDQPVQLRFLGDAVRDVNYPYASHRVIESFQAAEPLSDGDTYAPESVSVGDALFMLYEVTNGDHDAYVARQRDALVALYDAANGDDWNKNDNWLSDAPLGEWFGVTTDIHDRVVDLDLSQNQLSGTLPPEIGQLTALRRLDVQGNQLQGEIPPEIGDLDNVTHLSLWANQFSGSIPTEMGDMASLQWAALGINELTGPIPPELGNLSTATHLDFTLNQLSGEIPAELGNLTNLVWLTFWSNRLTGPIPPELGKLTNLEQLDLDTNRLSGPIPPELGNLVNLDELWLRVNELTGEIPPELGNLTSLQVLGLSQNSLTGEIPSELDNLTSLRSVYLAGNQFTGCVPAALAAIPRGDVDEVELPPCEAEESEDMEDTEDSEGATEV
ncbi:MAG: hypothetical protein OXG79_13460 [Chloroflexi bacterium]|nr:hypothetical protein [Chloroflexota bacterium]